MIYNIFLIVLFLSIINRIIQQRKLSEADKAKCLSNVKSIKNYIFIIISFVGFVALGCIFYFKRTYGLVIALFGIPLIIVIALLSFILTSIFQYKRLKQSGVPGNYIWSIYIPRLILIIFSIMVIIKYVYSLPPDIRQSFNKRLSSQLFPKQLDTVNLNYWVCPQMVTCKNGACIGKGGYGKFRFRAYYQANTNIPDGLYEFVSGEANINSLPSNFPANVRNPNMQIDNTQPPELFCEYGISILGFGAGQINVLAFAEGSFSTDYFERLTQFNNKWKPEKGDEKHFSCGADFDSYNVDCKFPPLQ